MWISVKTRLPEKGQKVLAWAPNGKDQVKNIMQQIHYYGGWTYGFYNNRLNGVTHWTPLPEPPTEER